MNQESTNEFQSAKRNWFARHKILTSILIGIILGFVGSVFGGDSDNKLSSQMPASSSQTEKKTVESAQPTSYEIVKAEDSSLKALERPLSEYTTTEIEELPLNKRMSYSVVVSSDIESAQVKPTSQKIVDEETRKDPDLDEIYILFYSDKEIADTGGAYDVATATWAPDGVWGSTTPIIARNNNRSSYQLVVKVRDDLEAYLRQRGTLEEKFGLAEEKRREIFKAVAQAEGRATSEADAQYPIDASDPNVTYNIEKNATLNNELKAKYYAEVQTKYGISEDIQWKIVAEAIEKNWPRR